ncbi:uncharacterized protein LOC135209485 [Macrobrachium nipponense]|uniref:uncharacterized protein LOC135209485 n=1 Tax=Macrobrachium nipponense TaxID=159736 RepID=UPI0030C7DBBE
MGHHKQRLQSFNDAPTPEKLSTVIRVAWESSDADFSERLISSIAIRLQECKNNKYNVTKYEGVIGSRGAAVARNAVTRDPATLACSLVPPLPVPHSGELSATLSLGLASDGDGAPTHFSRQREDVTGADVTAAEIQGLTPGTVYEFLIQSHNAQGRSNYTSSSAQIPVPGVVKEVASSSSSSNNSQPGVPLLTMFLTSLTGAALLVLNISIIVCFVKRFVLKRNTSAVSEAYGPVWTPGSDLETGRTGSIDSISSQVHYQFISQSPMGEEERRFSSTTHSLMTELSEYQKQEETPLTTIPTSDYFISTASPLSNYRSDLINEGLNLAARKSQSSKSLTNFNEFMTPGESQHGLDDNIFRRMKVRVQSPDIPDVCPKSPTLCPSLTRLQSCERIVSQLDDNEDRISLSSNHSDSSYKGIQGQGHIPWSAHIQQQQKEEQKREHLQHLQQQRQMSTATLPSTRSSTAIHRKYAGSSSNHSSVV